MRTARTCRNPPSSYTQLGGSDSGEELLASWPDGLPPFEALTLAVLEHLDKEGLSQAQALHLSAAPFIPVAHASRLVAPQQCFMRLGGAALAPFAWEVPGQVRMSCARVLGRAVCVAGYRDARCAALPDVSKAACCRGA